MPLFGSSKPDVEKMEAKRDVKGLVKALSYKNDSLIRKAAAEALVKIGDINAVDGLVDALKNQDTDVCSSAAEALVKIGNANAVDGLITALKNPDSIISSRAAEALGKIGDARAAPALTISLDFDPVTEVRESAAEAMKELEKKIRSGSYQPSPAVAGFQVNDLRSEEEKTVASRPQSTLEMEDEELAKKLAQLSKLSDIQYTMDKAAYEKTTAEFRRIGEQLCANGGDERMTRIALRLQAFGGRSQDCEMYWAGICGWRA